ncbi:hypothetical protein X975_05046, partial [Stegodyphus mimosarum]
MSKDVNLNTCKFINETIKSISTKLKAAYLNALLPKYKVQRTVTRKSNSWWNHQLKQERKELRKLEARIKEHIMKKERIKEHNIKEQKHNTKGILI